MAQICQTWIYSLASCRLALSMSIVAQRFYGKSRLSGEFGDFPLRDNESICRCGKR